MDKHFAYCSACDRQVEVVMKPGYVPEPGRPVPAEAMVCLAHGDTCTGALCPLFDVPPAEMGQKLTELKGKGGAK